LTPAIQAQLLKLHKEREQAWPCVALPSPFAVAGASATMTLLQVFNGSVCARHVASRRLGCQGECSAAVRQPHCDREALELEQQLQVHASHHAAPVSE